MFRSSSSLSTAPLTSLHLAERSERALTSRSAGVLTLTGVAAFLAAYRLATDADADGAAFFQEWMLDWAILWAALAVVGLWVLQPALAYLRAELKAERELRTLRDLCAIEPAMAHELQALALVQQRRDEEAEQARQANSLALESLGGLRLAARPSHEDKAVRLDTELGSAI